MDLQHLSLQHLHVARLSLIQNPDFLDFTSFVHFKRLLKLEVSLERPQMAGFFTLRAGVLSYFKYFRGNFDDRVLSIIKFEHEHSCVLKGSRTKGSSRVRVLFVQERAQG